MNQSTTRFSRPRFAWPLLLGALAMVATPSCDNPACVFGEDGCQVLPGGGANALASTFPATGETSLPGGPRVTHVFPTGPVRGSSPLVVVFSESISPDSIEDAFMLVNTTGLGNQAQPVEALVGDGRVLVLFPAALVPGQEYDLTYADTGQIRDLSGAAAILANGAVVGSFAIEAEPDDEPKLLVSWPFNGAENVSNISQVVTIFDSPVIPIVTGESWEVSVPGLDPEVDLLPSSLVISLGGGGGGQSVEDTRVWMWEAVDDETDQRVTLGENTTVDLSLSPDGFEIVTPPAPGIESFAMAPTNISFTTSGYSAPMAVQITSTPDDAIGIRNLTEMAALEFEVELEIGAEEGDFLDIFLVGQNPEATQSGIGFISRQRSVALSFGTTVTLVREEEMQLVKTLSPLTAQFTDGDVGIGFSLRRGDTRTAMRVLDVDLTTPGIQDARLDLQAPQFESLFGEDSGETEFITDLRELSIAGEASEEPNSALVTLLIDGTYYYNTDDPDVPPPVAASLPNGTFIARPVMPGAVEDHMPWGFSVIVYDRALNASDPAMFNFTQRGGSGGDGLIPGANVDVVVYNRVTLQPVVGALVISQGYDVSGAYDTGFTPLTGTTNTLGFASIGTIGAGEPVITIQAPGFDLFTFQGVPNERLEIPLTPSVPVLSTVPVSLAADGPALSSNFAHSFIADSRAILPGPTFEEADNSSYNSLLDRTFCTFGDPNLVRSHEVGLLTALSTKDPLDLGAVGDFSPQTYLLAFELDYPRQPITPPLLFDAVQMNVGSYLSGEEVDPADFPQGTPDQTFDQPINYGADFPDLVGNGPSVSVETLTYGLRGMMTVGLGLAYEDVGSSRWDIRSSYTTLAKPGGEFAMTLMIEDDRMLRVELVDLSGRRTGVRQPMSLATGSMTPPQVPGIIATVPNTPSYDITSKNILIDGGAPTAVVGLYRTTLIDANLRRWTIWTLDAPDGGDVVVHVPPIDLAAGGVGLMDGTIFCETDAWGWDAFDPENFLFTDIARRHEEFASSGPESFTQ